MILLIVFENFFYVQKRLLFKRMLMSHWLSSFIITVFSLVSNQTRFEFFLCLDNTDA